MRSDLSTTAGHFSVVRTLLTHARVVVCVLVFLLAFGVRVLSWHDTRQEVGKIQSVVVADYQRVARLLREGGPKSFFSSSSPLADLNNLGHPPGYSILIAFIQSVFGSADSAMQFGQLTCDALSAVMILLIVAELLPLSAGAIAGLLAALSPQFAWNSVLLLPDSISVLPVLIAIYLIASAAKRPRLLIFVSAGALIGISCWLRANTMLLTFFVALAVPLLLSETNFSSSVSRGEDRLKLIGRKWRFALAVVCGTLLVVLPLTLRNAIVFHRFIPLSLGAGQTLLEGIGDYDREGRFGIPQTDMGIMKQEAEIYKRPDYYGTLFNPDGVERERARLSRGFGVIRSHPLWFAGVMARRASSMVRLERSRLISTEPPVSHALEVTEKLQPIWSNTPTDLLAHEAIISPTAKGLIESDGQTLALWCDDSKYDLQLMTSFIAVRKNTDYVFSVPLKIERGRVEITVSDAPGKFYARYVVETREDKSPQEQPTNLIKLPLVATADRLRLAISNEAPIAPPIVKVGAIRLYELGPSRLLWTRYPRFVIHSIQKVFLTAVFLPLAIIGLLLLIFQKQRRALVILSIVPIYFFTVQSIVHTEYRYVLAVDYFLFALVGVTLSLAGGVLARKVLRATRH